MNLALIIDVAPNPVSNPVSIGVGLAVVIFVIAAMILLAVGLVFFLWYRKRSLRNREMIRPHIE